MYIYIYIHIYSIPILGGLAAPQTSLQNQGAAPPRPLQYWRAEPRGLLAKSTCMHYGSCSEKLRTGGLGGEAPQESKGVWGAARPPMLKLHYLIAVGNNE